MIHRALLGSLERFFGILIEHYSDFLWLAPTQVRILPLSEKYIDYAKSVMGQLIEGQRIIGTRVMKISVIKLDELS